MLKKWISNRDASSLRDCVKQLTVGGIRSQAPDTKMSLQEMQNMLETSEDQELLNGAKSVYITVNCFL
jgi:hypothetical protein